MSRIAGQVGKIENPETLPQERFYGALFEMLFRFSKNLTSLRNSQNNENTPFYLIKYAKYIRKIEKVLTIFRTRDKLSTKASSFLYLTLGSFNFLK